MVGIITFNLWLSLRMAFHLVESQKLKFAIGLFCLAILLSFITIIECNYAIGSNISCDPVDHDLFPQDEEPNLV